MSLLLVVATTGEGEMRLIFLMVNFELLQGHFYYVVIPSRFLLSMSECVPYILCRYVEYSYHWHIRGELYTWLFCWTSTFVSLSHPKHDASRFTNCFCPSARN